MEFTEIARSRHISADGLLAHILSPHKHTRLQEKRRKAGTEAFQMRLSFLGLQKRKKHLFHFFTSPRSSPGELRGRAAGLPPPGGAPGAGERRLRLRAQRPRPPAPLRFVLGSCRCLDAPAFGDLGNWGRGVWQGWSFPHSLLCARSQQGAGNEALTPPIPPPGSRNLEPRDAEDS